MRFDEALGRQKASPSQDVIVRFRTPYDLGLGLIEDRMMEIP